MKFKYLVPFLGLYYMFTDKYIDDTSEFLCWVFQGTYIMFTFNCLIYFFTTLHNK